MMVDACVICLCVILRGFWGCRGRVVGGVCETISERKQTVKENRWVGRKKDGEVGIQLERDRRQERAKNNEGGRER